MADNITLEEIPFGTLDETALNNTYEEDSSSSVWEFCSEFSELFILGSSLAAAIFILFVFLRFKTLRTRTNYYLMHYAIVSIMFIVATPFYEMLLSLVFHHNDIPYSIICTVYRIDSVSVALLLTFGFFLGLDYFIACYFDNWLNTYERIQKFLIIFVYLVFFVEFVIRILPCFGEGHYFSNYVIIVIYGTYVFLLTLMHIVKRCKKPEKDCVDLLYAWKMSNYLIYSWIPTFFLIVLLDRVGFVLDVMLEFFFFFSEFVTKLVIYCPPIVIAFWLRFADKSFEKAYSITFRKITRKYNQEECLEEEEDDGVDTNPILI